MKKYLKTFLPLILIVLIVWNLYPGNTEWETKKQLDEIKKEAEVVAEKRKVDSDGDGLLDWEEDLYQTNPEISDTDNDGVSDKEEVDQNRSPVVFGPGLTDDLRDLVAQKNIAENNLDVPERLEDVELTTQINSLSTFLEKAGYSNSFEKSDSDQSNEQDEIRKYFNKIADQILLADEEAGTLDKSLFALYEAEATAQDKEALRSLAFRYKFIGDNLADISTPVSVTVAQSDIISEKYLELSENFYKMIGTAGSYGDNDFKVNADQYTKSVTDRNTMFVEIHKFIKKKEVYFSKSDSGRYFLFEISTSF